LVADAIAILLQHGLETTMRMMLRITVPIEKGNETFKDGSLGKTMESIMKKLKPEAAYFGTMAEGKRGGMLFFDLAHPSDIVEIAEPLFLNLNAAVEFVPVMNADDLRKGLTTASKGKG
jgi:hypothetical protein